MRDSIHRHAYNQTMILLCRAACCRLSPHLLSDIEVIFVYRMWNRERKWHKGQDGWS